MSKRRIQGILQVRYTLQFEFVGQHLLYAYLGHLCPDCRVATCFLKSKRAVVGWIFSFYTISENTSLKQRFGSVAIGLIKQASSNWRPISRLDRREQKAITLYSTHPQKPEPRVETEIVAGGAYSELCHSLLYKAIPSNTR